MKRENNFDIIRLALAYIVVLFHINDLAGSPALAGPLSWFSGRLAVEGFFTISGFLIFASYERSKSLADYCLKRAARILPGYWVATAVCVGIAFSYKVFHVGEWLAANLVFANFLQPNIDGVFDTNPGGPPMNGALWTIKIEVLFYVVVPIIVWLGRRLHRDAVLWSILALSIVYRFAFAHDEKVAVQLPGQLCYFMLGALIHYHLAFFARYGKWLMLAAAALFALHLATGWFLPRPFAIATLTLGGALLLPAIKGPTRWGDFSYGTYVLHWPIIQLLVAGGVFVLHPWLGVAMTIALLGTAACLSWFLVEKPSLDRAHHHARRWRAVEVQEVTPG